MTIYEALTEAAMEFPSDFRLEDLTAMSYKIDPKTMALRGHPHFPDHRKTVCACYGKHGLLSRGMLEQVGDGLFRFGGVRKEAKIKKPEAPAVVLPAAVAIERSDPFKPTSAELDLYETKPYVALMSYVQRTKTPAVVAKEVFDHAREAS